MPLSNLIKILFNLLYKYVTINIDRNTTCIECYKFTRLIINTNNIKYYKTKIIFSVFLQFEEDLVLKSIQTKYTKWFLTQKKKKKGGNKASSPQICDVPLFQAIAPPIVATNNL